MTISPEAVQAALDAYAKEEGRHPIHFSEEAMKAALAAAFPIMLREGEYVRIEALLGDKAVEAARRALHSLDLGYEYCEYPDDPVKILTAAIETVKKGDV